MSDRLKFHVALPEKEYRTRDLSIPSEAAKTLYDIDVQQGGDRGLCLAVLERIFRSSESVMKVIHDTKGEFQSAKPKGAPCGEMRPRPRRKVLVLPMRK